MCLCANATDSSVYGDFYGVTSGGVPITDYTNHWSKNSAFLLGGSRVVMTVERALDTGDDEDFAIIEDD